MAMFHGFVDSIFLSFCVGIYRAFLNVAPNILVSLRPLTISNTGHLERFCLYSVLVAARLVNGPNLVYIWCFGGSKSIRQGVVGRVLTHTTKSLVLPRNEQQISSPRSQVWQKNCLAERWVVNRCPQFWWPKNDQIGHFFVRTPRQYPEMWCIGWSRPNRSEVWKKPFKLFGSTEISMAIVRPNQLKKLCFCDQSIGSGEILWLPAGS